ncbi:peroxiredoxin family protein [Crassaminicella profunda]|uniref:peroxiredoxin family protein n=1 Tax=Crassaminicella profunda TaxID=1286698 RepID=UPI001CA61672|nr:hypothetical protein [Crassaminicella profunda]QZY55200.1 hypothetical protein K7H06_19710 [Crassaminicella profunda]
MPALQAIYTEMQEKGINVLGIVADGMGNDVGALQILKKTNVTFTNIIPDEQFMNDFVNKTNVVPVSLLVNSKGEIVGELIVGSQPKEEFEKIIEQALKNIK